MSQGGWAALLVLLTTQIGQFITSVVQIHQMKVQIAELTRGVAKENANRRMQLEDNVDDLYRYIDKLRWHLHDWVDRGVLVITDRGRMDMSVFIPPPRPRYNGDYKRK